MELWVTHVALSALKMFYCLLVMCVAVRKLALSPGVVSSGVICLFWPGAFVILVRFDGRAILSQCVLLWIPTCLSYFGFSMLLKWKDSYVSLGFWNSLIIYLTVTSFAFSPFFTLRTRARSILDGSFFYPCLSFPLFCAAFRSLM